MRRAPRATRPSVPPPAGATEVPLGVLRGAARAAELARDAARLGLPATRSDAGVAALCAAAAAEGAYYNVLINLDGHDETADAEYASATRVQADAALAEALRVATPPATRCGRNSARLLEGAAARGGGCASSTPRICTLDLGPRNAALVEHLAAHAAAMRPDVLVVAGDVADTAARCRRGLRAFPAVPALRLYLPGNHDLYVEGEAALSRGETSPRSSCTCSRRRRLRPGSLPRPRTAWCGELAIVGTPGWYDYSLRDPGSIRVHPDHYRRGGWRTERAFDRGHVLWPRRRYRATPASSRPRAAPGRGRWICEHFLALLERNSRPCGARARCSR